MGLSAAAVYTPPPAPAPAPAVSSGAASIPEATKHTKYALSAHQFNDVPTAIKELREALANLGAS